MSVELSVLVAGAVLIVSSRTLQVLVAYTVLAVVATILAIPSASGSTLASALLVVSAAIKLVAAPLGIWLFVRRNPATRDLRASVSAPVRLLIAIALALVADAVAHAPAVVAISWLGAAAYIVLCALAMLIVHRNLIAHVIGLLALSAGVTVAGAALAPGLPESVELGASFDAVVVAFIGLALVRAFLTHNPMLDVDALRRLRG